MDKTYIGRSTLINSIVASPGLLEYVEGLKLMNNNDIILSDYRRYIVDINFKVYFNEWLSQWDKINKVVLNPV